MNIKGQGWRQEAGAGQLIPCLVPWGLGTWAQDEGIWGPWVGDPLQLQPHRSTFPQSHRSSTGHHPTPQGGWGRGACWPKGTGKSRGASPSRALETHF